MEKFKHISLYERQRIEKYLKEKRSLRFVARKIGRSVGSVSLEIKINGGEKTYRADKANHRAYAKRKYSKIQCLKVATNIDLKKFVVENIKNDQSPEGISGRLKNIKTDIPSASVKAIYKFVKSPHGRQIEKHLYSKSVKRKSGPKHKKPVCIDGRVMIDKRPKKVEKRLEFGHLEGDFIESGKDGNGSLLVMTERKTRYPFIKYLEKRDTKSVNQAIKEILQNVPIKSLTIDNDISFQKHKELSEIIGTDIFFCHPQSPHEKGTVENRNKAIRRYIQKRSDLSKFPKEYIIGVETILRNKFMKCLDYKTPQEVWDEEIYKIKNKKIPLSGIMEQSLLVNAGCSD